MAGRLYITLMYMRLERINNFLLALHNTMHKEELFEHTTISIEKDHPHIGRQIGINARYRGRNLLDVPSIRVTSIHRSGADAIARHLPIVDTLDAEGKPRFIEEAMRIFASSNQSMRQAQSKTKECHLLNCSIYSSKQRRLHSLRSRRFVFDRRGLP